MKKAWTIALATAKEATRQPAFFVILFLGAMFLIVSIFLSYYTLGEDIKMYKDVGLTAITMAGLLLALLTASSTVAEEIEGKTAVTLLSKPINRPQFILGKFIGIEMAVAAVFLILGFVFAAGVYFKLGYDLREASGGAAEIRQRVMQVRQILPGMALGFMEVTVLTSISVAISTRLPMLANLVVCIGVFFLGHLTPVMVDATKAGRTNELVGFMARLFSVVLPKLEAFNASPSIATGAIIPWFGYVFPAFLFCVMYSGAALLFALVLFENRDVA